MTRFARAKGSKSSNERVPDQATPWHVMKEQLEFALDNEQKQPQKKTKSAKELINEKDDLYYATSVGNINTDWAEFENSKNKMNSVKEGKVEKKQINQIKLKRNHESSNLKNMTSDSDIQSIKVEKPITEKNIDSPADSNLEKPKKKKRKLKEKKNSEELNDGKKAKIENSSKDEVKDKFESGDKLSKRQKRNQKKLKKMDQTNSVNNLGNNNCNNSMNHDEKKNCNDHNKQDTKFQRSDNLSDRPFNQNFKKNKLDRFGGSIPRKYQKKTAKIRDDQEHKRRKPNMPVMRVTINGIDVEIVQYDGFPVKKEDAERLTQLRKEMVLKGKHVTSLIFFNNHFQFFKTITFSGIPKPDINAAMKLERRKCEKALARIRKQVCFHCRKAGHNLSDCPELGKEESATGICFKCGSTEHTHFECKVQKSDDYKFAKCFICREQGHIAKQCPDNPKGLYPDGGGCKICGDVTHLKKDCPELVKEKEDTTITLDTLRSTNLELLDNESFDKTKETKLIKKVVKF